MIAEVKTKFTDMKISILSEGEITSEVIDSKKLIDQHYYAIASKATILKPNQLNINEAAFKEKFGLEWKEALETNQCYNALDACAHLGIDGDELDKQWGVCKKTGNLVKLGGGFYCGKVCIEGKQPIYSFNGFFMSMRAKFTAPGLKIHYFVVEFDSADLAWGDFRGKVLGPTDPADAPADSLRGISFAKWQELGLPAQPDTGDNSVHASASPFEALAERNNWLGVPFAEDSFGKELLDAGISEETLTAWSVDPAVEFEGVKKSIFDTLEDMDSDACLVKMKAVAGL